MHIQQRLPVVLFQKKSILIDIFLTWGPFYPLKIALQKYFLLHIFPITLEPLKIEQN